MLRGLLDSALRSGMSGRRGAASGAGYAGGYGTGRRRRGYGGAGYTGSAYGGGSDLGGQIGASVGRALFSRLRRR